MICLRCDMPRNLARSLPAAERKALAGENDSQDSHEKLLFLIQEHGIGVTTSSPTLDHAEPQLPIKVNLTSAPTSNPGAVAEKRPRQPQHPESASDASVKNLCINPNTDVDNGNGDSTHANVDAHADPDKDTVAAPVTGPAPRLCKPRSTAASLVTSPTSVAQEPTDSILCDAYPSSPRTRDDDIPQSLPSAAPLKTQTRVMSSQSLTQLNEDRSYEQYLHDGSQPSSPPGALAEEHRTLQEGDTGYVNFNHPFELPDTAPVEPDTPFPRNNERDDAHGHSQIATARTNPFAPETPAAFPRPFLSGGDGQLMAASQLFGQTQPTSALKKPSPTSSRPSPNVFGNTATSPTHPASSPLKNRGLGSTPLPLYMSTSPDFQQHSSRPLGSGTSPSPTPIDALGTAGDRDEDDLDKTPLPQLNSRRTKAGREPIDEYRPYRRQTWDSDPMRPSSQNSVDSDFERDDAEIRRRRARLHKEKASKSFPEISVPLPSTNKAKIEVPSTSRTGRPKDVPGPGSEGSIILCDGKNDVANDGSQETVADSQDAIVQPKSTDGSDMPSLPATNINKSDQEGHHRPLSAPTENMEKEMIPETSPACTFTEQPKLIGDIMNEGSSAPSDLPPLSYPTPSAGAFFAPSGSPGKPSQSERNASEAPVVEKPSMDSITVVSSPLIVPASSQQSAGRRSRRLNRVTTPSSTAPGLAVMPSDPGTASSALTVLSTTPVISSSLTPNTEEAHIEEPLGSIIVSSPAADRGQRRGRPSSSLPGPTPSLSKSKTDNRPRQSSRKETRRFTRHSSLSLDELDKISTVSTPEASRSATRKPPRKSTTLREFQTKGGLFEGMVFAISLQDRQHSQRGRDKSVSKSSLEDMIRQEGGKILDDGFNTLFEFDTPSTSAKTPPAPLLSNSLKLLDGETGFTALIADGHSRKVKYMQALALGIPCLAPKWVTACIAKKEVVNWSSYLLCAGSSTILGDAIRSRDLQPYDASTAKLAQVISRRPRLLGESKILLIMKKAKNEEKRLPYVFLAQVLGASLVRVHSVEEARVKLREVESGNDAFDWVYVDDHVHDARNALFGSGSNDTTSKKRKRMSAVTDVRDDPPPKRIRTLNDELVIQSLILGRLIEEEEMEE
ncbi:hypothetical protein F5Y07DRAFT_378860 [Xylaria sp. FL0933]|nr:hypothetical protein F5Y07DRAFT_378860 [Xylaria sp. FL0933]